ncbi:2Fe-2S iron-sulfur cluster binding domain-containing protein [Martelella lutilitoris]|uniref:2Fe-2S iron-sulfur cluster binding domain-containing protein n=1 Tax=Martelella lutilitoris TaxID=2583532 RepID=A0A7T7HK95_9HYPH|nr:2Fe-2S iron-sulfur cluster-binding protein [Martelella lutilitoris]QQM30731.1 2Fe-2S iron-sulfur cluster binding domain-containing protein [Martelella lutilitoris]
MVKIIYIEHAGKRHEFDVAAGQSVMEGARDNGVDGIVAECGGCCSCSTCHVYVAEDWFDRLPPIEPMEEDMLDFAPGMEPGRSRLSCQLTVTEELDGLTVQVPAEQA